MYFSYKERSRKSCYFSRDLGIPALEVDVFGAGVLGFLDDPSRYAINPN
jgi:hypothetical protein